jgi:hypothetical protein
VDQSSASELRSSIWNLESLRRLLQLGADDLTPCSCAGPSVAAVPERIDAATAELEALWSTQGLAILPRVMGPTASGFLVSNVSRVPLEALDFGTGPATSFTLLPAASISPICFVLPAVGDDLRLHLAAPNPLSARFRRGQIDLER